MSARLETLVVAKIVVHDAETAVSELIRRYWPPGEEVSWKRGRHTQHGTVVYCGSDGLRVTNDVTGKTYWISTYDMICVDERLHDLYFEGRRKELEGVTPRPEAPCECCNGKGTILILMPYCTTPPFTSCSACGGSGLAKDTTPESVAAVRSAMGDDDDF